MDVTGDAAPMLRGLPLAVLNGWLLTRRTHIDLLRTASATCRA